MIAAAALAALLAAAGWLAFVGVVCLLRADFARAALSRMGSTWPIHLGEHALRALFGMALVLRADASKAPGLFIAGGWFVIATSVLIVLAPRRWHHAFALWWADRIPGQAWRWIGLASLAFSGLLAWAAL